ncbi:LexA family protein [Alcaligenes faecalis]|uniref:LexA family protein n=1 Tax=Alcaligenes faecalis TaxID=511 RepID=UPI0024BCC2BF|nr:translesion error-prone DNA polymerase V autoproteolytic subunit [Alcaligenes faecalis]WHQ45912.1 translesion error-prone DNA polymerase V autoproteolytic subunit [Alcaligenes faecalis]
MNILYTSLDEPVPLSNALGQAWATAATVQCGFPSPAEDHAQERLDLNQLLINQVDATFFMRVRGPSMRDAGIDDGDYVVVDRSLEAKHGSIIVAVVDGEFTVKQLYRKGHTVRLIAANPTFPNIELKPGQELTVWGVVTWTLKRHTIGA